MRLRPRDRNALQASQPAKPRARPANPILRRLATPVDWRPGDRLAGSERRHLETIGDRDYLDGRELDDLVAHIEQLPAAGQALHCLSGLNFNAWDLVPATLRLAGRIERLIIATLGFNQKAADQLVAAIDAGDIGPTDLLCSIFFERAEKQVEKCARLAEQLAQRRSRFLTARNHCKLILMRCPAGDLVVEGSANLRSCSNLEQFTIHNSPGLFEFHARWIEALFDEQTPQRRPGDQAQATPAGRQGRQQDAGDR